MGFSSRFFVALLALCVVRVAWGAGCTMGMQNCPAGQYNSYGCRIDALHYTTGYSCVPCPNDPNNGFPISDAGGGIQQTINDCYRLVSCSNENCRLYYDGRTADSEHYHLENEQCVSNTKQCSEFDGVVGVSGNGLNTIGNSIFCREQVGTAQWNNGQWSVSNCLCKGSAQIQRYKCMTEYELTASSVSGGEIVYSDVPRYYYCTSCIPGTCPSTFQQNSADGVCRSGTNDSYYSVCACNDVSANYYSAGYSIPSNLSNPDAVNNCAVSCGNGLITNGQTGATSPEQCVPDGTAEYQDATGRFTLGTHQCQP